MVELKSFNHPTTRPIQFDIVNLSTQWRSIPAIGELFSRYTYDGLLRHDRSNDSQIPLNIPELPLKPLTIIPFKVENIDNMFAAKRLAGSNIHIYSAVLTAELTRYVARKFVAYNKGKKFGIGVICPYLSQSQLITKLIEQMQDIPESVTISVGTTHSFQGDQCNLVFTVFNPPTNLRSGASKAHINNQNIINVAISRAQDYLCVLMPSADCDGYSNLRELNRLGNLAKTYLRDTTGILSQQEAERLIFGSKNYLYNNLFVTSHQTANVYTKPAAHFEVRCDDKSIDIQVDESAGFMIPDKLIPLQSKEEEKPKADTVSVTHTFNKKKPEFKIIKMGEYRTAVVGKYDPIIPLLKKLGGYSSDNLKVNGRIYLRGYTILNYNVQRLLQMLEEDGWDMEGLKI